MYSKIKLLSMQSIMKTIIDYLVLSIEKYNKLGCKLFNFNQL